MDRKDLSYTILLIPGHNNGKTISLHCSRTALIAAAITGVLVLIMAGFATLTSFDSVRKAHALAELKSANEVLVKENGRVRELALKLGDLTRWPPTSRALPRSTHRRRNPGLPISSSPEVTALKPIILPP